MAVTAKTKDKYEFYRNHIRKRSCQTVNVSLWETSPFARVVPTGFMMHYYQFNIADYRKDTSHLSRLEHSIYRDLIDWYYLDECPIPKETQSVTRRLRLVTQEEATALSNVLNDFFYLSELGWNHKRIDIEIADYHYKCDKNKENGKKGGRPKLGVDQDKTQSVILANPIESESNPNHKPITNNHKPVIKEKIKKEINSLIKTLLPDVDDQVIKDFEMHRRNKKAAITKTAIEGIKREATKAGISLEAALVECCERGWIGFKAEWYQKAQAPPAYQTKQHLASVAARSIFDNEPQEKVINGEVIGYGSIAKQLG